MDQDAMDSPATSGKSVEDLENEIEDLREQLRLARCGSPSSSHHFDSIPALPVENSSKLPYICTRYCIWDTQLIYPRCESALDPSFSPSATHPLLLLADSALPLGSFAYSSGLESFLAHTRNQPNQNQKQNQNQDHLNGSITSSPSSSSSPTERFYTFLSLSLGSLASTTLPYVLKAHRFPNDLETLDNDLDASTPCIVSRRASVAQGLALLGVWERAYRASYKRTTPEADPEGHSASIAAAALDAFSDAVKQDLEDAEFGYPVNGHLAPLWGVVCCAMSVRLEETGYVFLLNHAKAVLSAAVRASVMGPYQAQLVLASSELQSIMMQRLRKEWNTEPADAGQNAPVLDLWIGRHELLYSRIFNS